MFHVVYSRHYWDHDSDGGYDTFANTWTLYRNVSYSQIEYMKSKIYEMRKNADRVYDDYEKKKNTNRILNNLIGLKFIL